MSMYAIKDTTLTALGDAVRSKSGISNEYYNIELIAPDPDNYAKEIITLNHKSKIIINITEIVDLSSYNDSYLNIYSNNVFIRSYEKKDRDNLTFEVIVDAGELKLQQYYGEYKFGLTIIPLDENGNEFKYTPLEMVDKINGLNTETGKKLPWVVQKVGVPNFTITAEDIAGVDEIGRYAFNTKSLTSIELPDTLKWIAPYSFKTASISEITFPHSVKSIDIYAFENCSNLKTIRILGDTSVIELYSTNTFNDCSQLTSIYIPSKLYNDYCADTYWSQYKDKFIAVGEWAFDPQINPILLFNQSVEVSIQLQDFANTPEFSITSSNEEVATISNVSINEDNTLLTYTINSLAVEGSSTITVNIVGEKNTFNFTNNVRVFETIPEPTYEVVAVDGATYGFALREDGYWESQNFKAANSAAVCQVNISNMKGVPVYFDCINYAEANYDYGLLGAVNQVLGKTNSDDSGVKKNFKGLSKADIQTVEYTDATGDCFIQVKFKKDSSGDQNNDSIRFKVRFGE